MIKIPLLFKKSKQEAKKIRKRTKQGILKKIPHTTWGVFFLLFLVSLGSWYLYTSYVSHPNNIIHNVEIAEESIIIYDSDEIEQDIVDYFSGVNFRAYTYRNQSEFTNSIKKTFPLIKNISTQKSQKTNTVHVHIQYHTPDLTMSNETSTWIAHENQAYKVLPADLIQADILKIRLPDSTNNLESLEGIFHHIHSKTIVTIINNITDIIEGKDISDIEYLPGGQKLHITYKGKLILFHLDKSIDSQLTKLLDLKQYYGDFSTVTRLDLGSNNDIIVK